MKCSVALNSAKQKPRIHKYLGRGIDIMIDIISSALLKSVSPNKKNLIMESSAGTIFPILGKVIAD
jgi:hypothetical protein